MKRVITGDDERRAELTELVVRKKIYDEAKADFDDILKRAVLRGESYSLLGQLLGQSNAAVRLKAARNGWDTDRRIPRKPRSSE